MAGTCAFALKKLGKITTTPTTRLTALQRNGILSVMKHEHLANAADRKELAKADKLETEGRLIRSRVLNRLRQRAKRERENNWKTMAERRGNA